LDQGIQANIESGIVSTTNVFGVLDQSPGTRVIAPAVKSTLWTWLAVISVWIETEDTDLALVVDVIAVLAPFVGANVARTVFLETGAPLTSIHWVTGTID
jgi:hypothetical protein